MEKLVQVETLLTVWDSLSPADYRKIFLLISEHTESYRILDHVPDKGTGEPWSSAHTRVWATLPIADMRAFQQRLDQTVWTGIIKPVEKRGSGL